MSIELHSIDYIPLRERRGKVWHQALFWSLAGFQPFTIAIGFIGPALGLSWWWSSVACLTGLAFGALFMAFHASQGPRLGLAQMVQSRGQLGFRGVLISLAVALFTFLGYNVLMLVMIASGLSHVFGWDVTVVALVATVTAAGLAILGYEWLHRFFRILLLISVPCWLILTWAIGTGQAGGSTTAAGGFSFVAFLVQFTAAASYNLSFAPFVSDFTRYLPQRSNAARLIGAVLAGAIVAPAWLMALGAWFSVHMNAADPLVATYDSGNALWSGLGTILLVLSVISLVASISFQTYSASLTTITAIDSLRRITFTRRLRVVTILALTVVWSAAGLWLTGSDLTVAINNALLLMLYTLVPWTAINLVDFFIVRHGRYAITDLFTPMGIYGSWAWRGLVAYLAGLAAEVPFVVLSFWTGPVAESLAGVDIAFVVGLLVAGSLYLALSRSLDLVGQEPAVALSEQHISTLG